jgi:hypothetical protein
VHLIFVNLGSWDFYGETLGKNRALLPILSLNPSFWGGFGPPTPPGGGGGGVLPPKPPVGGVAPPPNPPRISFSVGCLQAAADTFVVIQESLIIADCWYFCKCEMHSNSNLITDNFPTSPLPLSPNSYAVISREN